MRERDRERWGKRKTARGGVRDEEGEGEGDGMNESRISESRHKCGNLKIADGMGGVNNSCLVPRGRILHCGGRLFLEFRVEGLGWGVQGVCLVPRGRKLHL